jgi:hypothetical protein
MATGDDEVIIKIATDMAGALRAMVQLLEGFKDIDQVIDAVEKSAEEAGLTTDQFLTSLREGLDKSGIAATELGQNFAVTLSGVDASLKASATSAEGTATAITGIGKAGGDAAGQLDLFGNAVTTGMAGATETISGTKNQVTLLSEEFASKLVPSVDAAAASAGPLFTTLEEGGKAAAGGLGPVPPIVDGLTTSVQAADAQQLTFFGNLDKGTQTTWELAEAISDITTKREEERATFATFTDEQKQKTAELTAVLLEEGKSFEEIAAHAHLSVDALKLLNEEQA